MPDRAVEIAARAMLVADGFSPDDDGWMLNGVTDTRELARAALTALEREGLVLVPAEPSGEMLDAGAARQKKDDSLMQQSPTYIGSARNVYRAMLSARPQAEGAGR